ncbi:MAG: YihY/virulence factor BrkB family protein [Thermoleophilia bacterium]|nr:YihY/virulence factor BrkB family protein [Thermoleophilia bacterium]
MASPIMRYLGLDGLGGRRLLVLAQRTVAGFTRDRCTLASAGIAYHALLSIFPLAIVLAWIATWFIDDKEAITEVVEVVTDQIGLTASATADLEAQLERAVSASQPAGIIGLAILIWSASALMTSIRHSVNLAWGSSARRFYLLGKLIDIAIVAMLGVLIGLSIVISLARDLVPEVMEELLGPALLLAPVLVTFLGLLAAYRFLPAVRTYVRDIWPAALGGALAFEVLKAGFAIYLDTFSNSDVIYGSLGAVIGFMVFVYVAANLLLLGAELASELPRVRAGIYDAEPSPPRVSLSQRIRRLFRRATRGKPEEGFRSGEEPGGEPPP